MRSELVVGLLCVACLSGSLAAQERNLALGRPYTYYHEPNYVHSTDEGDAKQLTDGQTNYQSGRIWMQESCVGWHGADAGVVVLFDLGEAATLSELHFNTTGGGTAHVMDAGLQVYVSLENEEYVLAGELPVPPVPPEDKWMTRGVQVRVPLNDAKARYVAVVAKPPWPYHYVFVDEIEIVGQSPAKAKSRLPALPAIRASGAEGLREALSGRSWTADLAANLIAPIERHTACWPADAAGAQRKDVELWRRRATAETGNYDSLRAQFTEQHRKRARQVYGARTLVWEVVPDEQFTMLSLPETLDPPQSGSIHTVINALEATAFGAANLTATELPLSATVSAQEQGAPSVTPRVARFFLTPNAMYVPDALLADDCPQVIPPGESRVIWLSAETSGAAPGNYRYDVTIRIGENMHPVPLEVSVHNVMLSEETPLGTGNWAYLDTGEEPLYREVRDSMLAHRITIGAAGHGACPFPKIDDKGNMLHPMQLDFASMDKMLAFHKDFHQVSWYLPFNYIVRNQTSPRFGQAQWMSAKFKERFREWIVRIVARIKASGRDYDEFYFQFMDETLDPQVGQMCELVHSIDPKVRMMIASHSDASAEGTKGIVESGMNIFVHQATRLGYDNAPDGYPILRAGGRELHFYGAADRRCGNGRERDPLDFFRLMHWLAFRHGATGVHFWNMLHNKTGGWKDASTGEVYWPFVYPIGEAYSSPPDDVKTAEEVIPSRRWEYTRMGIEDYMLLSMARDKIDALGDEGEAYRRRLHEIVKTVLTNRTTDRRLFRAKRRELVELVEELPR